MATYCMNVCQNEFGDEQVYESEAKLVQQKLRSLQESDQSLR